MHALTSTAQAAAADPITSTSSFAYQAAARIHPASSAAVIAHFGADLMPQPPLLLPPTLASPTANPRLLRRHHVSTYLSPLQLTFEPLPPYQPAYTA